MTSWADKITKSGNRPVVQTVGGLPDALNEAVDPDRNPYEDYVVINCKPELLEKIHDALHIIWEHPEGKETIIRSAQLNGQLTVTYGDQVEVTSAREGGYVDINPHITYSTYLGEDGQTHYFSLTRVLAHEILHTTQPSIPDEYWEAKKEFQFNTKISEYASEKKLADAKFFHSLLEYSPHKDEVESGITFPRLSQIFTELYQHQEVKEALDAYITEQVAGWNALIDENVTYARFIREYETPAIEFENMIVEGQEPPRSTEYKEYIHEKITSLEKFAEREMSFSLRGASLVKDIMDAGGLEQWMLPKHGNAVEVFQKADIPTSSLNGNIHYHGAIRDVLLCDLDQPSR